MFKSCKFCVENNEYALTIDEDKKVLNEVLSDEMGSTLLEIKNNSTDGQVRASLSDLHECGDARALGKWCHEYCIRDDKRTCFTQKIARCIYVKMSLYAAS